MSRAISASSASITARSVRSLILAASTDGGTARSDLGAVAIIPASKGSRLSTMASTFLSPMTPSTNCHRVVRVLLVERFGEGVHAVRVVGSVDHHQGVSAQDLHPTRHRGDRQRISNRFFVELASQKCLGGGHRFARFTS